VVITSNFFYLHACDFQKAEQSGDEPPQQEEQSTESQGVTPGEEPKEEGEPEVKGRGTGRKMPVGEGVCVHHAL
jgi:hypothetical protein